VTRVDRRGSGIVPGTPQCVLDPRRSQQELHSTRAGSRRAAEGFIAKCLRRGPRGFYPNAFSALHGLAYGTAPGRPSRLSACARSAAATRTCNCRGQHCIESLNRVQRSDTVGRPDWPPLVDVARRPGPHSTRTPRALPWPALQAAQLVPQLQDDIGQQRCARPAHEVRGFGIPISAQVRVPQL
jgi:hypothetical protein